MPVEAVKPYAVDIPIDPGNGHKKGRGRISTDTKSGRNMLFRRSNFIVSTLLNSIKTAKQKNDYQCAGMLAIQAAQFIMPKLQAVAHISPNQAIETMEGLREFLISRELKSLPPASDTAIEGEFKEVAPAPIESPSETPRDPPLHAVERNQGNSAPSPKPSRVKPAPAPAAKPFSEMTREEVIKRYHPHA